jgi:prophage DNA circulation protein
LPDDLLKVFNTINNFGTKVVGITNAVSQIVGDVESVFKNSNSLFKTIQSGFQNNVSAIASTASSATTKVSTIKPTTPTGPTFGPQ